MGAMERRPHWPNLLQRRYVGIGTASPDKTRLFLDTSLGMADSSGAAVITRALGPIISPGGQAAITVNLTVR